MVPNHTEYHSPTRCYIWWNSLESNQDLLLFRQALIPHKLKFRNGGCGGYRTHSGHEWQLFYRQSRLLNGLHILIFKVLFGTPKWTQTTITCLEDKYLFQLDHRGINGALTQTRTEILWVQTRHSNQLNYESVYNLFLCMLERVEGFEPSSLSTSVWKTDGLPISTIPAFILVGDKRIELLYPVCKTGVLNHWTNRHHLWRRVKDLNLCDPCEP